LSLREASVATSYTVLVVEQTDVVRQITKRILSERGYRVLGAANTTEALAVLAMPETHIDLVLIGAVGSLERGQLRWEA
jgi:CheY-like chemotaxis protein